MKRREFLGYGGAGLAAAGIELVVPDVALSQTTTACALATRTFTLVITDRVQKLIDGEEVRVLAFKDGGSTSPSSVPGPVLRCIEGETISLTVTNARPEPHGFEITGIPASKITSILPGQSRCVTFTPQLGGTYMYHDASHVSQHLYRLLGLHGTFVVQPLNGRTAAGTITPYSMDKLALDAPIAASSISKLFDVFGTARFPGGKWVPCPIGKEFADQERIWLFCQIDPRFNALVTPTGITPSAMTTSAGVLIANFRPRYFTINGASGFDLSEGKVAESVVFKNYIGQPSLIRTLNAGLCVQSTHIHGNHIYELSQSYLTAWGHRFPVGNHRERDRIAAGKPPPALGEVIVNDDIWERDVWPTAPMQIRDVLLPFMVPPDIPDWSIFVNRTNQEPFPLRYVMHDHCEMATTAAGGNYPQGAVTHWEIRGPVRPAGSAATSGTSAG